MNIKDIMKSAEVLLTFCLCLTLPLSAFVFFFVFCINWEDWFFGIKLDGLPAGLFLFAKMAGAVAITWILAQYPRHQKRGIYAVLGYCGFLFFDTTGAILKNRQADESYAILVTVMFCMAVLLFVIHTSITMQEPGD
jgi:hypothetical protein